MPEPKNFLEYLLQNPWSIPVAIVCLTLSIFVHELGHFLAARWRGLRADRFSFFGLGSPIVSWHWRGVEWCICWIPIGAYVSIPQLADLGEIEGGVSEELKKLPPASYLDKVIVSAAGAAFNIVFALLLGTVLLITGDKVATSEQTTTIGTVFETMPTADNQPGPAFQAGLKSGDVIREIDGEPVHNWKEVRHALVLGSGRTEDQRRTAIFTIEREGKPLTISVHPILATADKYRQVGIQAKDEFVVGAADAGKPPAAAGLLLGDQIVTIDGQPIVSATQLDQAITRNASAPLQFVIARKTAVEGETTTVNLTVPAATLGALGKDPNLTWARATTTIYIDPFTRVVTQVKDAYSLLRSLFNRSSDIKTRDMGGLIAIVATFASAWIDGAVELLKVIVGINVSLAVLNMLPIPVLDGGHILFATIAKIRRRPLPFNFIATTQSVFFALLLGLMVYIGFFDVKRITRPFETVPPPAKSEPAPK